jgi:hypothetical protein
MLITASLCFIVCYFTNILQVSRNFFSFLYVKFQAPGSLMFATLGGLL